ncbi:NAD(P)H-dependent oxidoreductase [Patescibacteria group bacterium]|nr:NAD(P)H-dependent oxidoreductase [Patescibacteria group bacterium]
MKSKNKILIILGHPLKDSFCGALAQSYIKGANESSKEIKTIYLGDLDFDPVLRNGYKKIQELEPDLINAQEKIKWAEHIVLIYPTWWATYPALVKGFFDRILLPSFGFRFEKESNWLPKKLLKGRTLQLIITMDGPPLLYRFFLGNLHKKIIKQTLGFCGIKLTKTNYFGSMKKSSSYQRKKWLDTVYSFGKK